MSSNSLNKVQIIGTLGKDPEVRFIPSSNKAVAQLSVATSDKWTDKQTGQRQERTEWHRVVIYGKLAEIAGQYLRKGSQVYLEGKLQTRKWQDQSGQDRYTTEIVADEMKMLGGGGSRSSEEASQHEQIIDGNESFPEYIDDDIPF